MMDPLEPQGDGATLYEETDGDYDGTEPREGGLLPMDGDDSDAGGWGGHDDV
jgi:hypothetical protein